MENKKTLKILTCVILFMTMTNLACLYIVNNQQKEIEVLQSNVNTAIGSVSKLNKDTAKLDKGLVNMYKIVTSNTTDDKLNQLINELVEYGYILPIEEGE